MSKNLLVHLCTANRVHIIAGMEIFSSFLPEFDHLYLYVGARDKDKVMYKSRIEKYSNSSCLFLAQLSEVYTLSADIKNSLVLSHGFSYIDCFVLKLHGFKNVHWICWGDSVVAGTSFLSKLYRPFKKKIMRNLNGIIALMEPDKNSLMNNYDLSNVETISYISNIDSSHFNTSFFRNDKIYGKVLLGNNTDCIPSHIYVLDCLRKFSGKIKVHCLLNYSLIKDDSFWFLYNKGKEYFGEDFSVVESFMSQEEYIDFLKGYDVYICNMHEQTGLGANHRCLRLGKKLFLNGSNFDYVKQIGCYVNHVKDLECMSFDDFMMPLTFEQKEHNLNSVNSRLDVDHVTNRWSQYIYKHI